MLSSTETGFGSKLKLDSGQTSVMFHSLLRLALFGVETSFLRHGVATEFLDFLDFGSTDSGSAGAAGARKRSFCWHEVFVAGALPRSAWSPTSDPC